MRKIFTITTMLVGSVAIHAAVTACGMGNGDTSAHAGPPSVMTAMCDPSTELATFDLPGMTAQEIVSRVHIYYTPKTPSYPGTAYTALQVFGLNDGLVVGDCQGTGFVSATLVIDP